MPITSISESGGLKLFTPVPKDKSHFVTYMVPDPCFLFLPSIQTADYSYRAAVRELVPQLRYLDDLRVEEDGHCGSSSMGEDWVILRNSIRDCNSSQAATEDGVCVYMLLGSFPVDQLIWI